MSLVDKCAAIGACQLAVPTRALLRSRFRESPSEARHSYTVDDMVVNAAFQPCVSRAVDGACLGWGAQPLARRQTSHGRSTSPCACWGAGAKVGRVRTRKCLLPHGRGRRSLRVRAGSLREALLRVVEEGWEISATGSRRGPAQLALRSTPPAPQFAVELDVGVHSRHGRPRTRSGESSLAWRSNVFVPQRR